MAFTRVLGPGIHTEADIKTNSINATGIITATGGFDGPFTKLNVTGDVVVGGALTVGGVLTYEDVTNIDAIGVITARSGIDINGDLDVDGHTNLDNVSIAGVTTFSNPISVAATAHFNNQSLFFGPVLNTGEISISLVDNGIAATFDHHDTSGLGFFLRSGGDLYLLADHTTSTNSNGDGYGLVIKEGTYGIGSSLGGSIIPSHDYKPQLGLSNRRFGTIFADQGNFSGIVTAAQFKLADGSEIGAGVGVGGTWSAYSAGIATSKSVGVNTTNLDDTRITGVGNSFNGIYVSNGMMVNDARLDGDHFIGADVNGMMVGPVNITGTLTVEGNYVVF